MSLEDDLKEKLKNKISKDGIYISKTWDIRVVENFFKKLFSKKKTEEQNDERHEKDS